ncbi:MAG TPA: PQQ-binding-like beta-propeller repeat protein [Candidatus Paceibacterota bacterium]|nr:PQQ-binding-like beta-propeller repeat protein [Candidatus Paceibacterota bacterium]
MSNRQANASVIWTLSGGGSCRTGRFPLPVRPASRPARRISAHGALHASVVFDNQGRCFVADMAGWIQAFSAQGKLLWQSQLDGGISGTPAVDLARDSIYLGTHHGSVFALRNSDGAVLWKQTLPTTTDGRIMADLLLAAPQGWLVVSSWGGKFHAIETSSGAIAHSWDAGFTPQSGASADGQGNLYFLRAVKGGGVLLVRISPTGLETILHRQPEGNREARRTIVVASPVLDEMTRTIYWVANQEQEGVLLACSMDDDQIRWQQRFPRAIVATPALGANGQIWVADLDGAVRLLQSDGSLRASYSTGADYLLAGPVTDADGQAWIADPLGQLHALDSRGRGRIVYEAPRSIQARPAFDREGNLYVATTDPKVLVFQNRA